MARLKFGWKPGETLTYEALEEDGSVRTAAGTSIPEIGATGYYTVIDANVVVGDVAVINDGTRNVGFGEESPSVNCVYIEGDDFTDTLIGADGDTLESLSDQLDVNITEASKSIIELGPGE